MRLLFSCDRANVYVNGDGMRQEERVSGRERNRETEMERGREGGREGEGGRE